MAFSALILLALTFFVFGLSNMMEGNAVDLMMSDESGGMSQETYDVLMHEMGLDRPSPVRYADWLLSFLKGDMGTSTLQNRPVALVLPQRVIPTQGMYFPNQPHTFTALIRHLTLPAFVAGLQMTGNLIKQTRSAVLEVMNEEYIKTARSKGLSEITVVIVHGLRNALIPIITTVSLSIPFLVGGSVVIEKIFGWPSMGTLIINSVYARNFDPLMAAVVVICSVVLLANPGPPCVSLHRTGLFSSAPVPLSGCPRPLPEAPV